jgi:4-alpha-glucanotransferase
MDQQAGAPPDDFAVKGQNWGFPTYNWAAMQEDHFSWWKLRFKQMSHYFDAFRIDHILGFFRIWSIPVHAMEGILGRFVPAIPLSPDDFNNRGIHFDRDRLCKPYITEEILQQVFGAGAEGVKDIFLQALQGDQYALKEGFNTQRKIAAWFEKEEQSDETKLLKEGLFDLVANVILLEDGEGQGYHFRINMQQTSSYHHLEEDLKQPLQDLYIDYFYRRQNAKWKEEAMKKLPALKEATDMMICGEDLGMVPDCVPEVMSELGILSLEIQRMPKNPAVPFFNPKWAPYLSVITPSTHDMSTVRAWWEEDRNRTQEFYNTVLESGGEAPFFCESWISNAIVMQHLYSPAMWSIFQWQDLMGMNEELRRAIPQEERINVPAIPEYYWRYRMHMTLEDLLKEKSLNHHLKEMVTNSGRA